MSSCQPPVAVPQLDGAKHESVNCGPATACFGLDFATCGTLRDRPERFRGRITNVGDGGTTLGQLKRGLASYAGEAAAAGIGAPELVKMGYINRASFLRLVVQKGTLAVMMIKYGVVQRSEYRDTYSGADYSGGHFVAAQRLYRLRADGRHRRIRPFQVERVISKLDLDPSLVGSFFCLVTDPLADRRWSKGLGQRVPQASQMWPLSLLWDAANAYGNSPGDGNGPVGIVRRVEP